MNTCVAIGCGAKSAFSFFGRDYCMSHAPLHCHVCMTTEIHRTEINSDKGFERVFCHKCNKEYVRTLKRD